MRTSKAKVIEQVITGCVAGRGTNQYNPGNYQFSLEKYESVNESMSGWTDDFKYKTGKIVKPKWAFDMTNDQCSSGVHFFINLSDALKY